MKYKVFQMALVPSSCRKIKMQLSQQHLLKGHPFSNVSFQPLCGELNSWSSLGWFLFQPQNCFCTCASTMLSLLARHACGLGRYWVLFFSYFFFFSQGGYLICKSGTALMKPLCTIDMYLQMTHLWVSCVIDLLPVAFFLRSSFLSFLFVLTLSKMETCFRSSSVIKCTGLFFISWNKTCFLVGNIYLYIQHFKQQRSCLFTHTS